MIFTAANNNLPDTTSPVWLIIIIALAGGGAMQVLWQAYLYFRGGQRRKDRAEAAKASMDIASDTEKAPLVRESIALGNFEKALAIQQQVINALNVQRKKDQDDYLENLRIKDKQIRDLEDGQRKRDARIDELEKEILKIQERLNGCQRIIEELRHEKQVEKASHH